MAKKNVNCPICGKENWAEPQKETGHRPGFTGNCEHCIWTPKTKGDFLAQYMYSEQKDPAINVPDFKALDLSVLSMGEPLEANRRRLEEVLKGTLREDGGFWFGAVTDKENACKGLARIMKPVITMYKLAAED